MKVKEKAKKAVKDSSAPCRLNLKEVGGKIEPQIQDKKIELTVGTKAWIYNLPKWMLEELGIRERVTRLPAEYFVNGLGKQSFVELGSKRSLGISLKGIHEANQNLSMKIQIYVYLQ